MDNVVDNCGLIKSIYGLTRNYTNVIYSSLCITVDIVWMKISTFIRDNFVLSTFHRPITVNNLLFLYSNNGGTK